MAFHLKQRIRFLRQKVQNWGNQGRNRLSAFGVVEAAVRGALVLSAVGLAIRYAADGSTSDGVVPWGVTIGDGRTPTSSPAGSESAGSSESGDSTDGWEKERDGTWGAPVGELSNPDPIESESTEANSEGRGSALHAQRMTGSQIVESNGSKI